MRIALTEQHSGASVHIDQCTAAFGTSRPAYRKTILIRWNSRQEGSKWQASLRKPSSGATRSMRAERLVAKASREQTALTDAEDGISQQLLVCSPKL